MSWLVLVLGGTAFLCVAVEMGLLALGLGRHLLFERTPYGYRVRPSQKIRRIGRLSEYNEHGLRAGPLSPDLPPHGRIMCLGDSITNGGAGTDQRDTWPCLLEAGLQRRGILTQVMNASAGGWALDNEAGWLRTHGLFGARMLILEVGTHDLFQEMASGEIVGNHPSFPVQRPLLASIAVWKRYKGCLGPLLQSRWRPPADPGTEADLGRSTDQLRDRLATLLGMIEYARAHSTEVIIVHVEQPPAKEPTDPITVEGKRELVRFAKAHAVPIVETSMAIAAAGGQAMFRDDYHPNVAGNRVIASCLMPVVAELLARSACVADGGGVSTRLDEETEQ